MLIYLSGKIIYVQEDQIVLKLPNGQGYWINIGPDWKLNLNENLDLYIINVENRTFGFRTIEERLLTDKLVDGGLELEVAIDVIQKVAIDVIQKAIINKDESKLKKIEHLSSTNIAKILEIEPTTLLVNNKNSLEMTKESYTATEFTDKMQTIGYNRNQIVGVISTLKQESKWGQSGFIDLIKSAIEIIEMQKRQ